MMTWDARIAASIMFGALVAQTISTSAIANAEDHGDIISDVLVIPGRDPAVAPVRFLRASSLLGRLAILMRDAEREASFDPGAEVECESKHLPQARYQEALAHPIAARRCLKKGLNAEFLPVSGR
jgi:hypothetical protein